MHTLLLMAKIAMVVVLLVLAIASYFGVDLILSKWAQYDRWWSPLRPKPLDGQYNIMTRGVDVGGPFAGIINSVKDWVYEDASFVYSPGTSSMDGTYLSDKLGLELVGFFKRYYCRNRQYNAFEKAEGSNERKLVLKNRTGDEEGKRFFFQVLLAADVKGAETSGKPAVDAIVPFMMRVIDPNKAEFLTGKPEEVVANVVLSLSRSYIATKTYSELLRESGDTDNKNFLAFIMAANGKDTDGKPVVGGLVEKHGIEIFAPYLVQVDLVNKDDAFAKAVELKAVREQQREAAKVEAETIGILGDAEAERARKVFAAKGSVTSGGTLAIAESIASFAAAFMANKK